MPNANLYIEQLDICRYWPENAPCACDAFLTQVKTGEKRLEDCSFLTVRQIKAFKIAIEAEKFLPEIPVISLPQPIEAGLFPVNDPDKNAPVIVSANNSQTWEVLTTIWAQGTTPAYFLLIDCLGNTVDMAMIYAEFKPEKLQQELKKNSLEEKVSHRQLIIPGLASPIADDFAKATGWEVQVGPICAAELPLFLGDRWISL